MTELRRDRCLIQEAKAKASSSGELKDVFLLEMNSEGGGSTRVVKSGEVSEAGALRNAAVPVKKEKGSVKRRKAKASFTLLNYAVKAAFALILSEKKERWDYGNGIRILRQSGV